MKTRALAVIGLSLVITSSLSAATFAVPNDRVLVRQADAIIVASSLASYTKLNESGAIETVTTFAIEETFKGSIGGETIDVYEPWRRLWRSSDDHSRRPSVQRRRTLCADSGEDDRRVARS